MKELQLIFSVDFDGDGHLENVITSADAYVSKILPRVNPEVRFKSSAQTKKKTGKNWIL